MERICTLSAERIARALDVSLDHLLTGKSSKNTNLMNPKLFERIERLENLPLNTGRCWSLFLTPLETVMDLKASKSKPGGYWMICPIR
jgi:hypothetical protein